jgi:hypothetical protein
MRYKKRGEWANSRRRDGRCRDPEGSRALYEEIRKAGRGGITRSEAARRLGWTYHRVASRLIGCEALGLAVAEDGRGWLYVFGEELGDLRQSLAYALAEAWRTTG